jgi:serine palmitoyltransferase
MDQMIWQKVSMGLKTYGKSIYDMIIQLPLGSIIVKYIQNSYQNDPFRIVLEVILAIFTFKYLFSKPYSKNGDDITLTEKEVEELIHEWKPEPLIPQESAKCEAEIDTVPVLQG